MQDNDGENWFLIDVEIAPASLMLGPLGTDRSFIKVHNESVPHINEASKTDISHI